MEHEAALPARAPPVLPGSVPTPPSTTGVVGLARCLVAFQGWSTSSSHVSTSTRVTKFGCVARACWQFLRNNGLQFRALQAVESARQLPRARVAGIRLWFGRVKGFPQAEQPATILDKGVPIQVTGEADLQVALGYGNHRSIATYHAVLHHIIVN